MGGYLYADGSASLAAFVVFTLILGWLGGWATGRAFASTWRSPLTLIPATIALAAAVRFLHYAIAGDDLGSVYYYLVSLLVVTIGASYGFVAFRAGQMSRQYSWIFARSGSLTWRDAA